MNYLLRHLLLPDWLIKRRITVADRQHIEMAISRAEKLHLGEIKVIFEGSIPVSELKRRGENQYWRQRALGYFSSLGIWDTAGNSGVLIYIQLAEDRVEIIADRGVYAVMSDVQWQELGQRIESGFVQSPGAGVEAIIAVIESLSELLCQHFPAADNNPNEISNAAIFVGRKSSLLDSN